MSQTKPKRGNPPGQLVLSLWDLDNIRKGKTVPHLKGKRNIISTLQPLSFYDVENLAKGKTLPHLIKSQPGKTLKTESTAKSKKQTKPTTAKSPPNKKVRVDGGRKK